MAEGRDCFKRTLESKLQSNNSREVWGRCGMEGDPSWNTKTGGPQCWRVMWRVPVSWTCTSIDLDALPLASPFPCSAHLTLIPTSTLPLFCTYSLHLNVPLSWWELCRLHPGKAAGLDGISPESSGVVLLSRVQFCIWASTWVGNCNESLCLGRHPVLSQSQKTHTASLRDYRPVTLT